MDRTFPLDKRVI